MNDIFNITRFVSYLKRNLVLHKMLYVYLGLVLAGGYILSVLLHVIIGFSFLQLIKVLIPLCIVFGPCFFEKTITKYNGIFDFTFPVSNFERFLSLLLRYVIFVPAWLFGVYYLLTFLLGLIPVEGIQSFTESAYQSKMNFSHIYSLFAFQSLFLLGYLSFKKYAFVKTWIVLFIIGIFFSMILGFTIAYVISGLPDATSFFNNPEQIQFYIANKEGIIIKGIDFLLKAVFPFGLWVVSYFKIREKEI